APRRPQPPLGRAVRAAGHAARGAQDPRLLVQGRVDRLLRVRRARRGVAGTFARRRRVAPAGARQL
ncbi:MAG: hypothetical protein AVDCRST_MAG06-530, partial [uncultured Nocardioides sp.]